LIHEIQRVDREGTSIDAVIDTGDIVWNGNHSDQFALLTRFLAPLAHRPYLVGVGNHELFNNRSRVARENTVRFLGPLDPALTPDRLYYRKDIGPAAILFLDTNDFVYGETGDRAACPLNVEPGTREGRQLAWLRDEFARLKADPRPVTIAVMHHPLVQSSEKHKDAACSLWNFQDGGRSLVDILAEGGVDLVLTGHTHTYERFRLRRDDGREMHLVNVSGRPRDSVLWFGAAERRARDLRGREEEWLAEIGWLGVDRWDIAQEDAMLDDEADQFALVTAEPGGGMVLDVRFLEDEDPPTFRAPRAVRLR
jgi:3',5'-cyclic AMP phosphodiesterase CpdA